MHRSQTDNATVDPGGPASMLKQMVDVRAAQGYSVWKAETFVVNGGQGGDSGIISNAGGPAWGAGGKYTELRPEFWQAIDDVVRYVNSKGLIVSLAFAGIGRGLTAASDEAPITALAQYAVARYAGFHTVWTTCQEYCAGTSFPDAWVRIAALQWQIDPHKRSTSLHNCFANPIPSWRGAPWYGHVTLQQGHGITSPVEHWLKQYQASPPRVLVEDEANYERLRYGGMTSNIPSWLARQSAWQSQIGGATGFTYGGQGIWWACYDRGYKNGNCGPNDPPGPTPPDSGYYTWDQTLEFAVGGDQLPAMAKFFRRIPWHTLSPRGDAIAWDPRAPSGTQQPYQKVDPDGDFVVAYLPQADGNPKSGGDTPGSRCRVSPGGQNMTTYGGTVTGINVTSGPHRASWFNPRDGTFSTIAIVAKGIAEFAIPATRPGDHSADWVLLLEPASRSPPAAPVAAAAVVQNSRSWITVVNHTSRIRTEPIEGGCTFTATASMIVNELCRLPTPAARNVQIVAIYSEAGALLMSASVDALNASSRTDSLGFVCAPAVVAPQSIDGEGGLTLAPGSTYVLMLKTHGCDGWYDDMGNTLTVAEDTTMEPRSVYGVPPKLTPGGGGVGHCYGPLNFYFS